MRLWIRFLSNVLILIAFTPFMVFASTQDTRPPAPSLAFMQVRLDGSVKFSKLKPGDKVKGTLIQDSYSGYGLMAPKGSRVELTVSKLFRQRRQHKALWPWPVRFFLPRYTKVPVFRFAEVSLQDGSRLRLPVSVVDNIDPTHVTVWHRRNKKSGGKANSIAKIRSQEGPRLEVVIDTGRSGVAGFQSPDPDVSASGREAMSGIQTLKAGTEAKLALLSRLSASKSRAGDPFKALLVKPLRLKSGAMLPEGTVFEGRVTRSVPPRWLSRPGSLYLTFTRLILPTQSNLPIAASVAGVEVSHKSRMKVNSEGGMRGGSPGKARLLLDMGVGAGISKVSDDSYQLIAEALISTATDASTAGMARLAGFAFTGLYLLTRHGNDVALPRYTNVTIRFDRPPSFQATGGRIGR